MKAQRTSRKMLNAQADAATSELECIWGMATEEGNPNGSCLKFHAASASRHIATLVQRGRPLPNWALRNIGFLKAMGWTFYGFTES